MGKVRTTTIKRVSKEVLGKFSENFNIDFNTNKNELSEVLDIDSKKLRNRIAGYITRLKRIEEQNTKNLEPSEENSKKA